MRRLPPALILGLALATAGCDQVTKYQAVVSLTDGVDRAAQLSERISQFLWTAHPRSRGPITVVDGFWRFSYAENPGAAFSFLADVELGRWLLTGAAVLGSIMFLLLGLRARHPLQAVGAALVLGGAVGNLIDRVRLGYVIDFVQWHYRDAFVWPTFNVADAWIFVGGVLLLLSGFSARRASPALDGRAGLAGPS